QGLEAHGRTLASLVALAFAVAACSGTLVPITAAPSAPTPPPSVAVASPSEVAATPIGSGTTPVPSSLASPSAPTAPVEVALAMETATGAKDYSFVPTTLTAPAGSTITLTFRNRTNPDDEIGHNWVLVQPGQEASVLANGIAAGDDRDWLDVDDPGIIAATRLIEGKQRDSVTFDAPPPGVYTFVCTFPKHYDGGMQGTLTIE
ncbi:MAG: plastocyanin/azurin family copper-binding protein, partial [Candidatus Limnocylindrales bacterium]